MVAQTTVLKLKRLKKEADYEAKEKCERVGCHQSLFFAVTTSEDIRM